MMNPNVNLLKEYPVFLIWTGPPLANAAIWEVSQWISPSLALSVFLSFSTTLSR